MRSDAELLFPPETSERSLTPEERERLRVLAMENMQRCKREHPRAYRELIDLLREIAAEP
jgi:hypothetical protein